MLTRGPLPVAGLVLLTVAILFARRPDQFLHPYVWVEDGQYVMRFVIHDGWRTIFEPLAGYLLVASKVINYVAYSLSGLWAPELQVALTVAFTCGVACAIAFSPTHLRWPFACALAALLVPTNPEVFAIAGYAFWWAALLLILALVWDTTRGMQALRLFFITFGGLSSPLAISLAPLFLLRAGIERKQSEWIASGVAVFAALAQMYAIHIQRIPNTFYMPEPLTVWVAVRQFVGEFFHIGSLAPLAVAALLALTWFARKKLDRHFMLLVFAYAIVCASVAVRNPLGNFAGMDPFLAGPRYYFYPFILLSWIVLWLAAESAKAVQIATAGILATILLLALPGMQRRDDQIDWREQLQACARSETYQLPVHYNGNAKDVWRAPYTGAECRSVLQTDSPS